MRARPRSITGNDGVPRSYQPSSASTSDHVPRPSRTALLGGYRCPNPDTGFPCLRLPNPPVRQPRRHGRTRQSSRKTRRYITVQGQQFVPGDREPRAAAARLLPRVRPGVLLRSNGDDTDKGRACLHSQRPQPISRLTGTKRPDSFTCSAGEPWPTDPDRVVNKLPDDWVEEHQGSPSRAAESAGRICRVRSASARTPSNRRMDLTAISCPPVPFLPALRRFVRLPAALRFRQAGHAQLRRPEHRDHDPLA